jgi:hypothetical protein
VTTVVQLLNKVMADVGAVKKRDRNDTGAGFNFRGIDAVTNAVYPALVKHGVVVAPEVTSYDYGTVVVGRNRTEMGHVRLTVKFTWHGPDGDSITTVAAGEAFDSGDKATAKAHSVAFRTALLQTLCLPTDEPDPDSQSYERAPAKSDDDLAREELLSSAPEGWTPAKLADRFLSDHGVDIRQADATTVRTFTKTILAEAEIEPA